MGTCSGIYQHSAIEEDLLIDQHSFVGRDSVWVRSVVGKPATGPQNTNHTQSLLQLVWILPQIYREVKAAAHSRYYARGLCSVVLLRVFPRERTLKLLTNSISAHPGLSWQFARRTAHLTPI